jgi:hypothetical protein
MRTFTASTSLRKESGTLRRRGRSVTTIILAQWSVSVSALSGILYAIAYSGVVTGGCSTCTTFRVGTCRVVRCAHSAASTSIWRGRDSAGSGVARAQRGIRDPRHVDHARTVFGRKRVRPADRGPVAETASQNQGKARKAPPSCATQQPHLCQLVPKNSEKRH